MTLQLLDAMLVQFDPDGDARLGMLDALLAGNLIDEATKAAVLVEIENERAAFRAAAKRQDEELRARMTPEQRASDDRLRETLRVNSEMLHEMMLSNVFAQSKPYQHIALDAGTERTVATFKPEVGPGTFKYQTYELKAEIEPEGEA